MATHINDLVASTVLGAILTPQTIDAESPVGDGFDLGPGDGPCFAVQMVGGIATLSALTGRLEESDDLTTWSAISGAAFSPASEPGVQVIRFTRSRRYVRWAGTFVTETEDGTVACAALVVQPRKTF